uniref:SLIT-ROBO Rho GTPase activating protein 1 n=1 Tax=Homo sapiens TaxID=9606 RepID=A0A8Q3WKV0_HUMAN
MSTPSRFKKDKEIIAEYESQVKGVFVFSWYCVPLHSMWKQHTVSRSAPWHGWPGISNISPHSSRQPWMTRSAKKNSSSTGRTTKMPGAANGDASSASPGSARFLPKKS